MLSRNTRIRTNDKARLFGRGGPKALVAVADVPRRDEVGISLEATSHAGEAIPEGSIGNFDLPAARTAPAGVPRIDPRDPDPSKGRLILNERFEPGKTPRMEPAAVGPAASLDATEQVRQVLENERIPGLTRVDQRFAEDVVTVAAETSQSLAQAPKMAPCRPGAFRLEPASQGQHAFLNSLPPRFSKISRVARHRRPADPTINPDHVSGRRRILYLPVDGDMEEPAFVPPAKLCRTGPKAPKKRRLAIEPNGNFQPTADYGEGNVECLPVELVRTGIKSDRGVFGFWLRDGLAALLESSGRVQSFDCLHAGRNDQLAGKIELGTEGMVGLPVKLYGIHLLGLPPDPGNGVKGLGIFAESPGENLSLIRGQGKPKPNSLVDDH